MSSAAPKIRFRDPQIEMAHGAGGKASRRLVEGLFAPLFFGNSTEPLGDAVDWLVETGARWDDRLASLGRALARRT